jgi:hypothetical protein
MNFGTMQTLVYRNCGNMQPAHPFYSNVADNVNEAANRVIIAAFAEDRRAFNLFPELQNRRWWRLTDANANAMPIPDNMLVLQTVTRTEVATNYDPDADTEYKMEEETDPEKFALLDKTSTGWPLRWRRDGAQIYYWPTTSTSPTDYRTVLVARGVRKESALTSAQQTFVVNDLWHPVIVKCATAITMEQMGWMTDAERWNGYVQRDITMTVNPSGLEKRGDRVRLKVAGVPA